MAFARAAAFLAAALAILAPTALAQPDCSGFWVAPSGEIRASAGASGTEVVVYAPVGCAFSVSSNAGWLGAYPDAFTTAASQTPVDVFWEAATGTERSGSIAIQAPSGETQFVTVRQAGACAFTVDSSSFSFNRLGGSGYFVIGTDDACEWRGVSNYWIT